jgi:uncharacterized protein YjiS (DUF1127 family)
MSTEQLAVPCGVLAATRGSPPHAQRPLHRIALSRWLARIWAGRRSRRPLHDALHDFNDHMLADIGLHREARAQQGVGTPDPWLFGQHLR